MPPAVTQVKTLMLAFSVKSSWVWSESDSEEKSLTRWVWDVPKRPPYRRETALLTSGWLSRVRNKKSGAPHVQSQSPRCSAAGSIPPCSSSLYVVSSLSHIFCPIFQLSNQIKAQKAQTYFSEKTHKIWPASSALILGHTANSEHAEGIELWEMLSEF